MITNKQTIKWIEAVLTNDEASTDTELEFLFIGGGLSQKDARKWVAKRNHYLRRAI